MSPTNRWRRHAPQTLIDERHGMREKGGNSGSWRRAIRTRLFTFGQSSGPSSPTLENQSRADGNTPNQISITIHRYLKTIANYQIELN